MVLVRTAEVPELTPEFLAFLSGRISRRGGVDFVKRDAQIPLC
jgi:hypothetical protein